MHNRVRMIVASFLVKDLHLEWQHGARHFMRHLVDGDLASNQHGWQWVAGQRHRRGAVLPRVQPDQPGPQFDPDGATCAAGCRSSPTRPTRTSPARCAGYPAPIVDHAAARARRSPCCDGEPAVR